MEPIRTFEKLLSAELEFVHVSDRDFFTDEEVATRTSQFGSKGESFHLARRNRECYFIEPAVLARLLSDRFASKPGTSRKKAPDILTATGIESFLLAYAEKNKSAVQAKLIAQHGRYLRGNQTEDIQGLLEYFTKHYAEELAAGRIPWRLVDGKDALRTLRRLVQEQAGVSFSDRDVLEAYGQDDIPQEIVEIVEAVRTMFGYKVGQGRITPTPKPKAPTKTDRPAARPPPPKGNSTPLSAGGGSSNNAAPPAKVANPSAKEWLEANGHSQIKAMIDEIENEWRKAGKTTRRNWWAVLGGDRNGKPRIVAGRIFPVLEMAGIRRTGRNPPENSTSRE